MQGPTQNTSQGLDNRSYDPIFNLYQHEVMGHDIENNVMRTLRVNSSGELVVGNSVPRNISISVSAQSEGNLTLADASNWNVSHSFITSIKVTTSSTDWDLYLTDSTFDTGLITSRQLASHRSGNFDITVLRAYDSDTNVYAVVADNSGTNTFNILINGEERRV